MFFVLFFCFSFPFNVVFVVIVLVLFFDSIFFGGIFPVCFFAGGGCLVSLPLFCFNAFSLFVSFLVVLCYRVFFDFSCFFVVAVVGWILIFFFSEGSLCCLVGFLRFSFFFLLGAVFCFWF